MGPLQCFGKIDPKPESQVRAQILDSIPSTFLSKTETHRPADKMVSDKDHSHGYLYRAMIQLYNVADRQES